MSTQESGVKSYFHWNTAGFFCSCLGCSAWMLVLGAELILRDPIAALVCIAACVAVNIWGFSLWRNRSRLSAYSGIQQFLLATSVATAMIVLTVDIRETPEQPLPTGLISRTLDSWAIGVFPGIMLLFFFQERAVRRNVEPR